MSLIMETKNVTLNIPSGISAGTLVAELPASGQLILSAEKNAAARVVIRAPKRSAGHAEVRAHIAQSAHIEIVSVYKIEKGSTEETAWDFHLEAGAWVGHTEIIVGFGSVRTSARVRLAEPGASAHLNGLAVLGGSADVRNEIIVMHDAPDTVSRQRFKDILADMARSEYSGLVHVKRDALRSDSRQICRNLLLSERARALSRPQLKIDTDDVKCSHGSATGKLSDVELFYLRSRGLSPQAARAMLIEGFTEEILLELPDGDEALRGEAHQLVRCQLQRVAEIPLAEAFR